MFEKKLFSRLVYMYFQRIFYCIIKVLTYHVYTLYFQFCNSCMLNAIETLKVKSLQLTGFYFSTFLYVARNVVCKMLCLGNDQL